MFNAKSLEIVKQLQEVEKENAVKNYGATFNTKHEGYAVLLEEVEEVEAQINEIKGYMKSIWESVKKDDEGIIQNLVLINLATDYLAMESAQVHAVADKFIETLSKGIEE